MSHIWSYTRNGIQYAEVRTSIRKKDQACPDSIPQYLGKVIDLDQGFFKNKELGVYKYTLEGGVELTDIPEATISSSHGIEKRILDFGSSHLLAQFTKHEGLWDLFRQTLPKCEDSLMALLFYYVEMATSNRDAIYWLEGSYSHILFPSAQLESQRISELLAKLGDETVVRHFFSRYLKIVLPKDKLTGILIDSTGLPNAIHFPLTAVNVHNGELSEEVRLILVIDTLTGLPLFFRYNAGNIVDITTLKSTMNELKENGVSVRHAILDAGYCSEDNVKELYHEKIRFLTRLPTNRKLYKSSLLKYREEILSNDCLNMYQERMIGIKRIYSSIYGHRGYLYLCVDYDRRRDQIAKFYKSAVSDKIPRKEWNSHTDSMGFFGLVSSEKIEPIELLPLYYTRQKVEQIFDVTKTNLHIIPLRIHNEETFRGHILMTFMATVLYSKLNKCFSGHKAFTAENALAQLKNLKCKVYDRCILISELTKNMKDICKLAAIEVPEKINFQC
jgi:hypothetical protein